MRYFVVAGFLLTSASRGPSAIAEPLVVHKTDHYIFGPCHSHALCRCDPLLYLSHVMWSSSVSLCVRQMSELCKIAEPIAVYLGWGRFVWAISHENGYF